MSKMIQNQRVVVFVALYAIIVVCDLVCGANEAFVDLRYYTKPSILISLIIFFIVHRVGLDTSTFRLTTAALIFSLAGDVFLLFVAKSQLFFMAGLIMFLLAHIMYILVFLKKRNERKKSLIFLFLTIAYGGILFGILYKGLGDMLIPVVIYMIVILLMSNTAYLRKERVSQSSYSLVFLGSLFFMLSDSLLAFTMFYKSLFMETVWVMATYATAQFLIIYGILKQRSCTLSK